MDPRTDSEFEGGVGLGQNANSAALLFLLTTARVFGGEQTANGRAFAAIANLLAFQQTDWGGLLVTPTVRGDISVAVTRRDTARADAFPLS